MRLLERVSRHEVRLVGPFFDGEIPKYAILSHRWESDPRQEVDFADMTKGQGRDKAGYEKILFCAEQASRHKLQYFWVDTCCINKSYPGEHQEAIRSMFRWYQRADKCYAYLSDVRTRKRKAGDQSDENEWESSFRESEWFERGWTLQELLAPASVEFYSRDWTRLGEKSSLQGLIHKITGISREALQGQLLTRFSLDERFSWMERRKTTLEEDKVYALLGIFDVDLSVNYGEGQSDARRRLEAAINAQTQVIRDLRITNPRHDKRRIEDTKGGLMLDVCRWIFGTEHFQQWRRADQHQMLWIRGEPGKGKTMLICAIVDELERITPKQNLLSYFFCQATDSRINNAIAVLRGLLYMLIDQQPSLVSHIEREHRRAGRDLFEDVNSWVALTETFSTVIQDPRLASTVFIVDALDECVSGLRNLVGFITDIAPRSPRVKWLFSSRDLPTIEDPLNRVEQMLTLRLDLNATTISEAVRVYIRHKVDQLASEKGYDHVLKQEVLQHFLSNADGTFLWVALAIQSLSTVNLWHVSLKLKDFPSGLSALYKRMIDQIGESDSADLCQRILATVALVFRPVPLRELGYVVGLPLNISQNVQWLATIVRLCGCFLIIRNDTVFFVHQSAKDYILKEANRIIYPSGMAQEHNRLARVCIQRLSDPEVLFEDLCKVQIPGARRAEFSEDYIASHLPADIAYACCYWAGHFIESKQELCVGDYVHQFLQRYFLHWLESLSWLGQLSNSINLICELSSRTKESQLSEFLEDAHRFLLRNRQVIDLAPLQTYHSALVFAPFQSIIRRSFAHSASRYFRILPKVPLKWSAETQKLEGHDLRVAAVAFSPDGSVIVSASSDKTVRLWKTSTGEETRKLEHNDKVRAVAFSPDGSVIASASSDKTVRLWKTSTGEETRKLEHNDKVTTVAFSPDGSIIASTSIDKTVRLWKTSTGEETQKLEHDSQVVAVAFSPDGSVVLSTSTDTTVRLWKTSTGEEIQKLEGYDREVSVVAFSPDGSVVAIASSYYLGTVRLWDTSTGEEIQKFDHKWRVRALAFSPDRSVVVSSSSDKIVRLWKTLTGEETQKLEHDSQVIAVAFSPDGSAVASASIDGAVRLWKTSTDEETQKLEGHDSWVETVVFSPDGSIVASASSSDKTVRLWKTSTGEEIQKLEGCYSGHNAVVFSPDGSVVAFASIDSAVRLWKTSTGEAEEIQMLGWYNELVGVVAFSPDGSVIASNSSNHLKLWKTSTGEEIQKLEHDIGVKAVAFSPDGSVVASNSSKNLTLWKTSTGEEIQKLEGHDKFVNAVGFSGDGSVVISASIDKTVRLWKTSTGEEIQKLEHDGWVNAIAFSPDGSVVALASPAGTLRLRNRFTTTEVKLIETSRPVDYVAFSEDGRVIRTNIGYFDSGLRQSILSPDSIPDNYIQLSDQWIRLYDQNFLWLPLEYRGTCSAASGDTLVVGQASGAVSFFKRS